MPIRTDEPVPFGNTCLAWVAFVIVPVVGMMVYLAISFGPVDQCHAANSPCVDACHPCRWLNRAQIGYLFFSAGLTMLGVVATTNQRLRQRADRVGVIALVAFTAATAIFIAIAQSAV